MDWQAEEYVLTLAAVSRLASPESLDRLAGWHYSLTGFVARNPRATGEILHRIVTEYDTPDHDWEVEMNVGRHRNAQAATLQTLAGYVHEHLSPDEDLDFDVVSPRYAAGSGSDSFDALVTVMCHVETPEPTRRMLERKFQSVMKMMGQEGQGAVGQRRIIDEYTDHVWKLVLRHRNLCSHTADNARRFLKEILES